MDREPPTQDDAEATDIGREVTLPSGAKVATFTGPDGSTDMRFTRPDGVIEAA